MATFVSGCRELRGLDQPEQQAFAFGAGQARVLDQRRITVAPFRRWLPPQHGCERVDGDDTGGTGPRWKARSTSRADSVAARSQIVRAIVVILSPFIDRDVLAAGAP